MELVDIGLYLAYLLIAVAALTALVFPLMYVARHPKEGKDILIGVGALLALFVVSYIIAGDTILPKYANYGVGSGESKLIGAGLISFYILIVAAIVTAIYAEISKLFK